MAPQDRDGNGDNELQDFNNEKGNCNPKPTSQKQWPKLSSYSIRGGRTTPMNSTGTGRHPQRGRAAGALVSRDYRHQRPYHSVGSVVVEERLQLAAGERRGGKRHIEFGDMVHVGHSSTGAIKEGISIPTAAATGERPAGYGHHSTLIEYMNPHARLERHLKRYERGLKEFYMNCNNGDAQNEIVGAMDSGEEEDEKCIEDDCFEFADEEDCEGHPGMHYGNRTQRPASVEMPLRPSRVLLTQRAANTMYSFTGDGRYKYRGGSGAPLCAVLGPNGSTLRRRADPVRRGQQMREIWKSDKFLAQQGRKDDRWRLRQSMLAWDP
ncbi:hypothetical protein DQ04_00421100 [Trypanosoma grayi]|uniref:hypothetical protein n=1 Tax=Trypanosoma grayi TaxID=71804 RepID=UPI0004F44443|nr:hypothetical protein DQ04_00421100 [Trypanosoma grayi]KEG14531.1 hypothetical protein DQ04_00421100 [Trypanosoma grayi]